MITVHLVFNAHLDPVWMWPWQAGVDEALATCRSACDRLDAHPDLIFTRGEAWVYQQVQQLDPDLFKRIRDHVQAGRWEIVGGWWIQPDCNQPSYFAMQRQLALGHDYFRTEFGAVPRTAYNVDSFGHAATLPTLMHAAGQNSYIMMRPSPLELELPSHLFRWREKEGSPEVLTFRIASGYLCYQPNLDRVRACLQPLPPGVEHTMCFMGVGDHGGGPTEAQIAWCRENEWALDGCRLVFSSPSRFFAAVASQRETCPLVTGELQMHAVGCYSVYRPVKTALRRAEHFLRQAELAAVPEQQAGVALEEAWKRVCFHHFHDTLGGTCIPSAYPQVLDGLGLAAAVADETLQYALRHRLRQLPPEPLQRMVFFNASDMVYDGWVEFEPWLDWQPWQPGWQVLDEAGQRVPFQQMHAEAQGQPQVRLLMPLRAEAGELRPLSLRRDPPAPPGAFPAPEFYSHPAAPGKMRPGAGHILNDAGAGVGNGKLFLPGCGAMPAPYLELIEDVSDTWSHWIEHYPEGPAASPHWNHLTVQDRGPLMASALQQGTVGESTLAAEWRVYQGAPWVELRLRVHWREYQKVLKLTVPLAVPADHRLDGIPGGSLQRPNNGRECPLRDWSLLLAGESGLAVLSPDIYALDARSYIARFTLLRASPLAWHEPYSPFSPRRVVSDQGVHHFTIRFYGGPAVTPELLDRDATMLQRPLVAADLTRGMPCRFP